MTLFFLLHADQGPSLHKNEHILLIVAQNITNKLIMACCSAEKTMLASVLDVGCEQQIYNAIHISMQLTLKCNVIAGYRWVVMPTGDTRSQVSWPLHTHSLTAMAGPTELRRLAGLGRVELGIELQTARSQ